MATFLDVTGLAQFTHVFVFLFILIGVYGVLTFSRFMGGNKTLNALAGLLAAIFVIISPTATKIVASMAPFVTVVMFLIVIVSLASGMLGGSLESFPALKGLLTVVFIIVIVIFAALQFRDSIDSSMQDTSDLSKTMNVVFNPAFLGMVLLFAISVFTIALLTAKG